MIMQKIVKLIRKIRVGATDLLLFSGILLISLNNAQALSLKQDLLTRIDKINNFSAQYQSLTSGQKGQKDIVGSGEIALKKPSSLRFIAKKPDENEVITDGKTLWFFDPFVEQVSIYNLANFKQNNPFFLLLAQNRVILNQFIISKNGDDFRLLDNRKNSEFTAFEFNIDPNGVVNTIKVEYKTGASTSYKLSDITTANISSDKFKFKLTPNISVDDQRKVGKK